jgi:hypothetical protein
MQAWLLLSPKQCKYNGSFEQRVRRFARAEVID